MYFFFFLGLLTVPLLMTATIAKNQKVVRSTNVNLQALPLLLTQATDEVGHGITLAEGQDHILDQGIDPETKTLIGTGTETGRNHGIRTGQKRKIGTGIKGQKVGRSIQVRQNQTGDLGVQGPGPVVLGVQGPGPVVLGVQGPGLLGPGVRGPDLVDLSDQDPGPEVTGQEAEVDHGHHLWIESLEGWKGKWWKF